MLVSLLPTQSDPRVESIVPRTSDNGCAKVFLKRLVDMSLNCQRGFFETSSPYSRASLRVAICAKNLED